MLTFPCLMYHNLSASETTENYTVKKAVFDEHLRILNNLGFEVIDCLTVKKILDGDVTKPPKFVVITFDDGHKSNLDAAEILDKYRAKATFFLTMDLCRNGASFLSDDDIKMISNRFDIGSHGLIHMGLNSLPIHELIEHLVHPKNWLEEISQKQIISMSLPGGYYNSRVVRQAFNNGYEILATSDTWYNRLKEKQSHYLINRMAIRSGFGHRQFLKIINLSFPFYAIMWLRHLVLVLPKYALRDHHTILQPY